MRKIGVLICTKLPVLIEREAITPEIGAIDVGVGQLEVGHAVGGARVLQVVADLVVVVGADQLLLGQLLARGRSWSRACASAPRSAPPAAASAIGIEADQGLAGADLLAFLDQHVQRHAGGLGHHLRFGRAAPARAVPV